MGEFCPFFALWSPGFEIMKAEVHVVTPPARPPLTPLTIAKCPTPGCNSIEVKPEKFPSQHIIDRPPYAKFFLVSYEGRCSLCDVPLVGTFEYQAPDKDKPGQSARISTATAEKEELSQKG